MRKTVGFYVYVAAVLAGQLSVNAGQDGMELSSVPPAPAASTDSYDSCPPDRTESHFGGFNGFSLFRAVPSPGAPGTPGEGFPHFPFATDRYTHWYRPRAATLTECQRCAPDAFRPRGFGHLFARPCDSFRMEYSPAQLSDGNSVYGPAYWARHSDPRCKDCDHSSHHDE